MLEKIKLKINAYTVLLFDMDGTLIMTDHANFLAYKKAIESVRPNDWNFIYTPNQRLNRYLLKKIIPNLTEIEYEEIISQKERYYTDFIHNTEVNEVVAEILSIYSKTNTTILITNSRKKRALSLLSNHGLYNKFNQVFYNESNTDEISTNKYKIAISKLGITTSSIIAFEDEQAEINKAVLAGIKLTDIIHIQ